MEEIYRLLALDVDLNAAWMPSAIFNRMQESAEADAEDAGLGRVQISESNGLAWAITRMHLQMDHYPHLGQRIKIRTWSLEPTRVWFRRQFLFSDMDDKVLGRASSQWVLLDLKERILRRPSILGQYPFDPADEPVLGEPRKILLPANMELREVRKVRYSDVDMNGHMNNTKYLNWICELFPVPFLRQYQMRDARINYVAEARIEQDIELYFAQGDGGHYISGRTGDKSVFDAHVTWQEIKEDDLWVKESAF